MTAGTHQVRVHDGWPSGQFVACTCTAQSPTTCNSDDITTWIYTHLGRTASLPSALTERVQTWDAVPAGALF